MGIRRGPNTVTDGLVFAVDAANPTSYTSGSATCKNLIGSNILILQIKEFGFLMESLII